MTSGLSSSAILPAAAVGAGEAGGWPDDASSLLLVLVGQARVDEDGG